MIYRTLKWVAGIALHWFYGEVRVVGRWEIPADAPLLIAANHQNALVDSLIVGWILPRKIAMTAKATLTRNPLIAALFKLAGVVALRRVSDEIQNQHGERLTPSRNAAAFDEILSVLAAKGAILIFPEGKSHNESALEPLRTGLARMALQARDERATKDVVILPIGLVFENKGMPGTGVAVQLGEPIKMDAWLGDNATTLTTEIAARLNRVTSGILVGGNTPRQGSDSGLKRRFVGLAAAWGRFIHHVPLQLARRFALRNSVDNDQPATLTMLFGLGFVLTAYIVQVAVVTVVLHSVFFGLLYLVSLVGGAYWAAFEKHGMPHTIA
jgi:1-acyl-sn-glycerol-3-phosphate acyltransferase